MRQAWLSTPPPSPPPPPWASPTPPSAVPPSALRGAWPVCAQLSMGLRLRGLASPRGRARSLSPVVGSALTLVRMEGRHRTLHVTAPSGTLDVLTAVHPGATSCAGSQGRKQVLIGQHMDRVSCGLGSVLRFPHAQPGSHPGRLPGGSWVGSLLCPPLSTVALLTGFCHGFPLRQEAGARTLGF